MKGGTFAEQSRSGRRAYKSACNNASSAVSSALHKVNRRTNRQQLQGSYRAPVRLAQGADKDSLAASNRQDEILSQAIEQAESSASAQTTTRLGPVLQPAERRAGDVINGQYTIEAPIGRGSNGQTYRARTADGTQVAVKELALTRMTSWKQLDLFEREARTLRQLKHPAIPRYIDYFEVDTDADRGFFLVQELAEGRSLGDLIREGWRPAETEVLRIAKEMLGVLQYLGARRPAVVHRDIKPENIVLEGGKAGGRVFMVDFGGVQDVAVLGDGLTGSTIIGTYGYMAPEQFRGTAVPASDLYALGATLLCLASGQPPSRFPQAGLRIDFEGRVQAGRRLSTLLRGLLEPLPDDRLTAEQAMQVLEEPQSVGGSLFRRRPGTPQQRASLQETVQRVAATPPVRRGRPEGPPPGARSLVYRDGESLLIEIPPAGLLNGDAAFSGFFAVAWNAFVAFWTVTALAGGGIIFALFSLPFWFAGVQVGRQFLTGAFQKESLLVDRAGGSFRLTQQLATAGKDGQPLFNNKPKLVASGKVADLRGAQVIVTIIVNGEPQTAIELQEGVQSHVFGEALRPGEQQYLADEINSFLPRTDVRPQDPSQVPRRNDGGRYGDSDDDLYSRW